MIEIHLKELLRSKGIRLTELSEKTGITIANLSILQTNKAKAIRFSTLILICEALDCQPGDFISYKS